MQKPRVQGFKDHKAGKGQNQRNQLKTGKGVQKGAGRNPIIKHKGMRD